MKGKPFKWQEKSTLHQHPQEKGIKGLYSSGVHHVLGSTIIEVAIGVVFVYVLLSLICSAINEWIVGIFRLRASFLRRGITNLLTIQSWETCLMNFEHPAD